MKQKINDIKFNIFNFIRILSIKFCFSDKHDDDCNGCIFKNFKIEKCPLIKLENKLESKMKELY